MKTRCPHCKSEFDCENDAKGQNAECPECGQPFVVEAVTVLKKSPPPPVPKKSIRASGRATATAVNHTTVVVQNKQSSCCLYIVVLLILSIVGVIVAMGSCTVAVSDAVIKAGHEMTKADSERAEADKLKAERDSERLSELCADDPDGLKRKAYTIFGIDAEVNVFESTFKGEKGLHFMVNADIPNTLTDAGRRDAWLRQCIKLVGQTNDESLGIKMWSFSGMGEVPVNGDFSNMKRKLVSFFAINEFEGRQIKENLHPDSLAKLLRQKGWTRPGNW